jgi:phosphoribosyl-ATP pyrophosphohydrolase/phosphoribosyl-AMP cyclohydrolase
MDDRLNAELTLDGQLTGELKLDELRFDDRELIPVIVQDYKTGEVLMLAYMNRESLGKTISTGKAHYWSRSRNKLWLKGETSGNFQQVVKIQLDCDGDALLLKVAQQGVACHTGNKSCFYKTIHDTGTEEPGNEEHEKEHAGEITAGNRAKILEELYNVIADRKVNPREGSYTNYLFNKGLDKILKKVGEEASEVIIAAKNESREELKYEIADFLYHVLVLMVEQGLTLEDIYGELRNRRPAGR